MPKSVQREVFVTVACENNSCKSHQGNSHKQQHVVVFLDLMMGSESYRCLTIQCESCGHHSQYGATFPVTIGHMLK